MAILSADVRHTTQNDTTTCNAQSTSSQHNASRDEKDFVGDLQPSGRASHGTSAARPRVLAAWASPADPTLRGGADPSRGPCSTVDKSATATQQRWLRYVGHKAQCASCGPNTSKSPSSTRILRVPRSLAPDYEARSPKVALQCLPAPSKHP